MLQARRRCGLVAGLEDARRDQRDRRVRFEDEAAAELLEDDHRIDRAEPEAAVRFRNLQAEDAELADLVPRVAREAARLDDAAAALEVVAALDPAAHGVAQHLLVVGEVEVHGSAPEHRLGDDVALDFVAATVDRRLAHVEVGRRERRDECAADLVGLPAGRDQVAPQRHRCGPAASIISSA